MKVNRAVYMTFASGTSTATVTINVPFQVKYIHCKSVGYITTTPPAAGDGVYAFIVSDLTQNTPLAMIYQDSTYPYTVGNDVEYVFQTPQPVNGNYTFTVLGLNGSPLNSTNGGDSLGMILEFNDEYETR